MSDDKQPEFRSLSEFYITIFLNKLKILENTNKNMKKNPNKTYMDTAMGPLRDSRAPSWPFGPPTDVPAERIPSPIDLVPSVHVEEIRFIYFYISLAWKPYPCIYIFEVQNY